MPFGGQTFDHAQDGRRLGRQLRTVIGLMQDGEWRTLSEISRATAYPEASVSARLRDVRKHSVPAWTMESRRRQRGLWEYRICSVVDDQPRLF